MKAHLLNAFLLLSACALLGANLYLRARPVAVQADSLPSPARTNTAVVFPTQTDAEEIAIATVKWAGLEAEEYADYMANLRRFGFPEELIRHLITAEIDAQYAARIDPLKEPAVPHDAPPQKRSRKPKPEDIAHMRELQKLLIEKQAHLKMILGEDVPREMIRTPTSRNWEAHEYAVSLLPADKQDRARLIQENLWIQDDENKSGITNFRANGESEAEGVLLELEAYRRAYETRNNALREFLTEEEYERFQLNTMPVGTELARNVIGMDPTDEELVGMYEIARDHWQETGGVYGRWRATQVPVQDHAAADERLEAGLSERLGTARYIDYRMARTTLGQQLNTLADRYGVPRERLREAFEAQLGADRHGMTPGFQQRLEDALGPIVYEAWRANRGLNYRVEP